MPRKRNRERVKRIALLTYIPKINVGIVFAFIVTAAWFIVLYQWVNGGLNTSTSLLRDAVGSQWHGNELHGNLELIEFDPANSKATYSLVVLGPGENNFPEGYESAKFQWISIEQRGGTLVIPLEGADEELIPGVGYDPIYQDNALGINISISGNYPFETYESFIEIWVSAEYKKQDGQIEYRQLPVPMIFSYHRSQYEVRATSIIKEVPSRTRLEIYPEVNQTGRFDISLRQPLFIKIALPIIFSFLFLVSILVLLFGKDLSSVIEIAVAVFLGTWGVSQILIPNEVPYVARQGVQISILFIFLMLALSILIWAIKKLRNPKSLE